MKTEAAARMAWTPDEIEFEDGIELGWRFNPLEARNTHGEWTRSGAGYVTPDPSRLVLKKAPKNSPWPVYMAPTDHPFFKAHPVSAANIIKVFDASTPEERAQGMRWYADAHHLAKLIGQGDVEKGAGALAAYSPQTAWPVNMFNAARAIELGKALGPGDGMITGSMQKNAQEALDGDSIDQNFGKNAAPKIRAFAKLIEHGGDEPDDQLGYVVIDRHAMTVAIGQRLPKKEADQAPINKDRYYQYVSDAYRNAALEISKRGTPISPHQLQAITWLHQQAANAAEDEASGAAGSGVAKGRRVMLRNAWQKWGLYAKQHHLDVEHGTTALGNISAQVLELGWRDAYLHEERNTKGEWTHGEGLPGEHAGSDVYRPGMQPAAGHEALNLPGRPEGVAAGTAEDPIDVKGDMKRAVELMAADQHVRLNGPSEVPGLMDEINRQGDAQGAGVGHNLPWDLANISVRGTRLFNEQTIGTPRQDMPQLNGPAEPGTEAAILAGGANRFVELDPEFRAKLHADGIEVSDERVPVGELRAAQTQLTATSVAGIYRAAKAGNPKVLAMLKEPLWVTRENYVLDGHHRWAADSALKIANGQWPRGQIAVQRIDLPVRLAVQYAGQFAQGMGIGGRALGNTKLVESSNISAQVLDLSWRDAWRHELRDSHGRWTRTPGIGETGQAISATQNNLVKAIYAARENTINEDVQKALGQAAFHLGRSEFDKADAALVDAAQKAEKEGEIPDAYYKLRGRLTDLRDSQAGPEKYPGEFSFQLSQAWKNETNADAKQDLNLAGASFTDDDLLGAAARLQQAAFRAAHLADQGNYQNLAERLEAKAMKDDPLGAVMRRIENIQSIEPELEAEDKGDNGEAVRKRIGWAHRNLVAAQNAIDDGAILAQMHAAEGYLDDASSHARGDFMRQQLADLSRLLRQVHTEDIPSSPASLRGRMTAFIGQGAKVVPGLIGGKDVKEDWNGKLFVQPVIDGNPDVLGVLEWDRTMGLQEGTATSIKTALDMTGEPISNPAAFTVPLHELIHGVTPKGERTFSADKDAYQDRANANIEEGATELGTIHHAPEYFDAMGVGDRQTQVLSVTDGHVVDNPDWEHARQALHDRLRATAASLRADTRPHSQAVWNQVARDVDSAADYVDQGMVSNALMKLDTLQHLGSPDSAELALKLRKQILAFADIPESQHATMSEYARRLQDPSRISNGDAWGHYPQATAAIQDWILEVAKAEKEPGEPFDASGPGAPDWHRLVELANEINSQGTAGKIGVMATQIQRTFKDQLHGDARSQELEAIIENIRDAFQDLVHPDGKAAFRNGRHYHSQTVQSMGLVS